MVAASLEYVALKRSRDGRTQTPPWRMVGSSAAAATFNTLSQSIGNFALGYEVVSWLTIPTTGGSDITVYVDSVNGNNAWDGRAPAFVSGSNGPKKDIINAGIGGWDVIKAHTGGGHGDQLLLACGGSWANQRIGRLLDGVGAAISGQSWARPFVIGTYGTGARPLCTYSADTEGLFGTDNADTNNYVIVDGIEATTTGVATSNHYGLSFLGSMNHILLQDVKVTGFFVNLRVQADWIAGDGAHQKRGTDITVRGSCFADADCLVGAGNAEGMFVAGCDGVLYEFCIFDNNGWAADPLHYTIFRHNVYTQDDCTSVACRNCFITNGDGLQMKIGGTIQFNVFSRLTVGLKNGQANTPPAAGVTTITTDNCFLEAIDPPVNSTPDGHTYNPGNPNFDTPLRAGQALFLGNLVGGTFARNYFVGGTCTDPIGIWIKSQGGTTHGVENVTFQDMIYHNVGGRLFMFEAFNTFYNANTITNIVWQNPTNSNANPGHSPNFYCVTDGGPSALIDHSDFALANCKVSEYPTFPSANAVSVGGGAPMSLAAWFTSIGATGCSTALTTYPDPDRSLGKYAGTIGLTASHAGAITALRAQRKQNWRNDLSAGAVQQYVAAGFGL